MSRSYYWLDMTPEEIRAYWCRLGWWLTLGLWLVNVVMLVWLAVR